MYIYDLKVEVILPRKTEVTDRRGEGLRVEWLRERTCSTHKGYLCEKLKQI